MEQQNDTINRQKGAHLTYEEDGYNADVAQRKYDGHKELKDPGCKSPLVANLGAFNLRGILSK